MTIKNALFLLFTVVLAGCGTHDFSATVTRFHRDIAPAGQTFTIRPQADQQGSVEFDTYAGAVVSQMASAGFKPAAIGKPADVAVEFRYGVDNGRSEIITTPLYGRDAFWQRQNCAHVLPPFPCATPPVIPDVQSFTVFTRWVELSIVDSRLTKGEPVKLFEGRAYSEGASRNLPDVVPALIAALFTDFPGLNGETRTISVPPDCCNTRRQ